MDDNLTSLALFLNAVSRVGIAGIIAITALAISDTAATTYTNVHAPNTCQIEVAK